MGKKWNDAGWIWWVYWGVGAGGAYLKFIGKGWNYRKFQVRNPQVQKAILSIKQLTSHLGKQLSDFNP